MNSLNSGLAGLIGSLKSSPLFQLSLASKELFHSNFLAWLCETYPEQMSPLLWQFLPQPPDTAGPLTVYRERKNIDLSICFPGGAELVIENKVKSIPDQEQLKKYALAAKNKPQTGFLLLSLTRPSFLSDGETVISLDDEARWHYLSYRDLAEFLSPAASTIAEQNAYHAALLDDYIKFISLLDRIQSRIAVDWDTSDANFFEMQEKRDQVKEIRLHDLVDKLRYAQLAQRVADELKSEDFDVAETKNPNGEVGQIAVSSDMTRGMGLFDMKYLLTRVEGEPVILGVQIQGRQFRLNVEMIESHNQLVPTIADFLLAPKHGDRIWFNLDAVPSKTGEYPLSGNFNKYGDNFRYRYKKLGSITAGRLVDTIIHYARVIREHQQTLRDQVAQVAD